MAEASNGSSSKGAGASGDAQPVAFEANWMQRKKERTESLKKLREEEKKALKALGQAGQKDRLAYLMRQADIFTHFVRQALAARWRG